MKLCPSKNAPAADMVMTPPALAKAIVAHFNPTGYALEPCRGGMAFFKELLLSKCVLTEWCEQTEGRDFLTELTSDDFDWIITNPPWSKFRAFLSKSMHVADNVVFLATITHFVTRKRMALIEEAGFGFKEILNVKTPPHPWPQSGFQVAAVHLQRGWTGDCKFSKL